MALPEKKVYVCIKDWCASCIPFGEGEANVLDEFFTRRECGSVC